MSQPVYQVVCLGGEPFATFEHDSRLCEAAACPKLRSDAGTMQYACAASGAPLEELEDCPLVRVQFFRDADGEYLDVEAFD